MSFRGLRKPAWQAFALLFQHAGDTRLPTDTSNQTAFPATAADAVDDTGAGIGAVEPPKRVVSAFATANA